MASSLSPSVNTGNVVDLGMSAPTQDLGVEEEEGSQDDIIDFGTSGPVEEDEDSVVDLGVSDPVEDQEGPIDLGHKDPRQDPETSIGRATHFVSALGEQVADFFVEDLPKTAAFLVENTALGGPPVQSVEERMEEVKNQSFSDWLFGGEAEAKRLESNSAFKLGERLGNATDEIFPENPEYKDEFLANALPKILGEIGVFFGGGALGTAGKAGRIARLAGKGRQLAMKAGATVGAASQAPKAYDRAKEEGASDDEAFKNFVVHIGVGGLEAVPIAQTLTRLNRVTGGRLQSSIGKTAASTLSGVGEEASQEAVAQTLSNVSEKSLYDETRNIFENVPEAAALGGIAGGVMNGAVTAVNQRMQQAQTRAEAAEAAETADLIREESWLRDVDPPENLANNPGAIESLEPIKPEEQSADQQTFTVPLQKGVDYLMNKAAHWFDLGGKGQGVDPGLFSGEKAGVLPEGAAEELVGKQGRLAVEFKELKDNVSRLHKTLREAFGGGGVTREVGVAVGVEGQRISEIPQQVYKDINDVLRGRKSEEVLPENAREPVRRMRLHIDRLSRRLVNEGIAQGELKAKIKDNIGVYLTRAYKKHDFENWYEELGATEEGRQVKQTAISHIREKFREEYGKDPIDVEGVNKTADQIAREIAESDVDPFTVFQKGDKAAEGINWGVLKERGEIAPEIRALMGEYEDGIVNYTKSVQKVAQLIETKKFQDRVRELGLDEGWLHDPAEGAPPESAKKITSDGSTVMEGLTNDNGDAFWADPEIANAFEREIRMLSNNEFYEKYVQLNGLAKSALTIGNFTTWLKNAVGGGAMYMQSGHNPFRSEIPESFRKVKDDLLSKRGTDQSRIFQKYVEQNLQGGGGRTGELQDLLGDISLQGGRLMDQVVPGRNAGKDHRFSASRSIRRTAEKAGRGYQAVDDFWRLAYFTRELEDHADAFFDKPYSELSETNKQRVEAVAGEKTRMGYQDYSSVPKAIQQLRRAPFSNFFSFTSEMLRTGVNNWRMAIDELGSGNPKLRKKGARRLLSVLAWQSGAVSSGVSAAGSVISGIAMGAQEIEDMLEHGPPWDRGGAPLMVGKEERVGNAPVFNYINVSQYDPYSVYANPIRRVMREGPSPEAAAAFATETGRQFSNLTDPSLVAQKGYDLLRNETPYGAKIYQESGSWGQFVADVTAHVSEVLIPSSIQNSWDAVYSSTLDAQQRELTNRDPGREALQALGLRVTEVDPERSLGFQGSNFEKEVRQHRSLFNEAKHDPLVGRGGMRDKMRRANEEYQASFEKTKKKVDAAYRLGMPWDKIESSLRESGVAKSRVDQLKRGVAGDLITPEDFED